MSPYSNATDLICGINSLIVCFPIVFIENYFLLLDKFLNDLYKTIGNHNIETIVTPIIIGITHNISFNDSLFIIHKYNIIKLKNQFYFFINRFIISLYFFHTSKS